MDRQKPIATARKPSRNELGTIECVAVDLHYYSAFDRLCAVEGWVKTHIKVLELVTGWSIGEKDASDDRLARVVEELGRQEEARTQIEMKMGQHLIRAYELPTEVARADTSSFSVNHQQPEPEEESLLRYGHSKDKRPDLLQYRELLATLDPAGIPLVSATKAGNGADDPLYWPTWQEMAKVIGKGAVCLFSRLQGRGNRDPCSDCVWGRYLLFSLAHDWTTPRIAQTMGTQPTDPKSGDSVASPG